MGILLAIIALLLIIQPCLIGYKILADWEQRWVVVFIPLYIIIICAIIIIAL